MRFLNNWFRARFIKENQVDSTYPNWNKIKISFGSGSQIPNLLDQLKSIDENVRCSAYSHLESLVVLQSGLFEGTYYVIEPLVKILESDLYQDKHLTFDLLYEIFNGYAEGMIQLENGQLKRITEACQDKVLTYKERIIQVKAMTEKESLIKADLLETLNNPPPLFVSEEEIQARLDEILAFMKKK